MSRDQGQRYRSQDTELDTGLKIQRNSIEKKLRGDRSWWTEFNSLRQYSPPRARNLLTSPRADSRIPLNDVMKLTNKLSTIGSGDIPKLSIRYDGYFKISYVSELTNLQETLSRIIREANRRR